MARLHQPPVFRGADGMAPRRCAARCATGQPTLIQAMSPATRGGIWRRSRWPGRASRLRQICAQIKDPERNAAGRCRILSNTSARDGLVGWGWAPGAGRTPVPGSQEEAGALVWLGTDRSSVPARITRQWRHSRGTCEIDRPAARSRQPARIANRAAAPVHGPSANLALALRSQRRTVRVRDENVTVSKSSGTT